MIGYLVLFFLTLIAVGFPLLSHRFDRQSRKRKLTQLLSYPLVSIIVPAYKAEKTIAKTLKSAKLSDYPNKEIIVVNDSNDGTPEIAKRFGASVIQNRMRMGKGVAINIAAKQAKGDFMLVLDADAILKKCTLTKLMMSYKTYEADGENVGIVSPRYVASNRKNIMARLSDMEQSMHQNIMKIQMNLGSILSIRGSCLLMPRAVFSAVEGFSMTLLEDGDFTAKVIKAGYKIKYEPKATVMLREPVTLSSILSAKRRYGKGTFYCMMNHMNPYATSKQALVCFYPYMLLALSVLMFLISHNPLSLAPMTILLAMSASYTVPYALVLVIAAVSALGLVAGLHYTLSSAAMGNVMLVFVAVYIPIAFAGYFMGVFSGVRDRLMHRPELEFSNWAC